MIMYNGMLKPASKYTVRGFLWYQGESNVGHPDYAKRLATMVEHWRGLWGQEELPFYLVEIAPYEYGEGDQAAYLREEQYKATRLIPNSGIPRTIWYRITRNGKYTPKKNKRSVSVFVIWL